MEPSVSAANTSRFENATGVPWTEWVSALDSHGSRDQSHADIAQLVTSILIGAVQSSDRPVPLIPVDAEVHRNPEWWAQGITVTYEQHIGRRLPGQRPDGTFEGSVSRTVRAERSDVKSAVTQVLQEEIDRGVNGLTVIDAPRTSSTPKRDYWRAKLSDGSRIEVSIEGKESASGARSLVTATHTRLLSPEAIMPWKAYWKELLQRIDR